LGFNRFNGGNDISCSAGAIQRFGGFYCVINRRNRTRAIDLIDEVGARSRI
jgi:hypothetical protein